MTTYLDVQTSGSHLFPFDYQAHSLIGRVAGLVAKVKTAMAQAKLEREVRNMSDHLLADIGLHRGSLNF